MALRCLQLVVDRLPAPIFVYHEIVHNQRVVAQFEQNGVTFVDHVEDVPIGATLVFSAHGISPEVRRQAAARKLKTIDATCPLVAKVHTEVVRFASSGYKVILIGHEGHDEVLGTVGEAPEYVTLVQTEADVADLPYTSSDRLAYLTQTTLSVSETDRIISRLKARFPNIEGPAKDDICYATQNRQQAVSELTKQVDVVIVVGSQNSSNSRRLCEVATEHGCTAHLVDDDKDLRDHWFQSDSQVGVTAGASAPEEAVQEVVDWLKRRFHATVVEFGVEEQTRVFPLPPEVA